MRRSFCALAAALVLGLTAAEARSDEVDDATQLLRNSAVSEALAHIDKFLKIKPEDARGRFLKGVILSAQQRSDDAIAVFRALNADMPELPEPYNNLAVLYAAKGRYDDARRVLEMAIIAHPSYALAHENLGDIYARMAGQFYERAATLGAQNTTASEKHKLIDKLLGPAQK